MAKSVYDDRLEALRSAISSRPDEPIAIDATLEEILEIGDERVTRDLLLLLTDDAEDDEGMFSIIHAAESTNDSAYVQAMLLAFPELVRSAPRWASIVFMRVLNNSSSQLELVRQLRVSSVSVKELVHDMCRRINDVSPQFLTKTTPVALATV